MNRMSASALAGALLCALAAFGFWSYRSLAELDLGNAAAEAEISRLRSEVDALRVAQEHLRREVGAIQARERASAHEAPRPQAGPAAEESEPGAEAAAAAPSTPAAPQAAEEGQSEREAELAAALETLFDQGTPERERRKQWRRIVELGQMDAAVAAFERRAEENSHNPDLQTELGHAYIQKLLTVNDGEKAGWSMKAHAAYDKALALDQGHWEARFSKAINYAFAPPIFGLQAKAIEEFETLRAQQESRPPEERFAETYVLLGNLYQNQGNAARAREVWQRGAEIFPEAAPLKEKLQGSKAE